MAEKITASYYAIDGVSRKKIDCDSVELELSDGRTVELQFRKSDGEISLNGGRGLKIRPMSGNVVRIELE